MLQCICFSILPCLATEDAMHTVRARTGAMRRFNTRHLDELSAGARRRLKWFDWHAAHGKNVSKTCRHFSISRQTFYRWQRRYKPWDLTTLEDRPSRPKKRRQRTWATAQVLAVQELRERYPRWGKAKLCVLLVRRGIRLSVSMVGRILRYLKQSGKLKEPRRRSLAQRRQWQRPYATRKPREYSPRQPGDLIQLDTLDVRLGGEVFKQFTAVDGVSRFCVLSLASNATARLAVRALDAIVARMPFVVRAVQVDGGSEFMAEFEQACKERGLLLFELPPRSPQAQRPGGTPQPHLPRGTLRLQHRRPDRRFPYPRTQPLRTHLQPHPPALGYLTPAEYLVQLSQKEKVSRTC